MLALAWVLAGCAGSPRAERPTPRPMRALGPAIKLPTPVTTASVTPFLPIVDTPTPTPPLAPVPLTTGACCSNPFWSPDSQQVLFIDRPEGEPRAALYGVTIPAGERTRLESRVGVYSRDLAYVAYPMGTVAYVERREDGQRWPIHTGGSTPRFSPSGEWVLWQVGGSTLRYPNLKQRAVWVSTREGAAARQVVRTIGGGAIGWGSDEESLLVSGRMDHAGPAGVWRVPLDGGTPVLLFEAERVRSPLVSPDGAWLAFIVAFEPDARRNGLWALDTQTGDAGRLELFGAYRWRRKGVLLVVPLDLEGPPMLWQVDVTSGRQRPLTDPDYVPLPIADNDWQVSTDGAWLVFRSAEDGNLWLLELPR